MKNIFYLILALVITTGCAQQGSIADLSQDTGAPMASYPVKETPTTLDAILIIDAADANRTKRAFLGDATYLGAQNGEIGDVVVWVGACTDSQYTSQSTCETAVETWVASIPIEVPSAVTDLTAGNWKVFHSNGTGAMTELTLGANGTYLKSNGATAAPTWGTPAGGGDLSAADIDTSAELRTILTDEVGTGAAYFVGGELGTPASATLTNATGLPVSGITASTSTALGVGSVELGHASDTTITRTGAGAIAVEGVAVTRTIASGTASLGTSAISSGTCASVVTVTATNTATTDVVGWGFSADPTSTTGYSASANGMLTIIAYPTSNNVNFKVCNNLAASVTPGAVTLNWRVVR